MLADEQHKNHIFKELCTMKIDQRPIMEAFISNLAVPSDDLSPTDMFRYTDIITKSDHRLLAIIDKHNNREYTDIMHMIIREVHLKQ